MTVRTPLATGRAPTWLFLHSSDEWYGADRMLVEFIMALPEGERAGVMVWLPDDVPHGDHPLCGELSARGIAWEHRPLPVVRRRDLTARGLAGLSARLAATAREVRRIRPGTVVLATSALVPLAPWLPDRRHTRVVLHLQELWQGKQGRILGMLARRVDRVIAISGAVRDALPSTVQRRTIVVANGTPEPEFIAPLDPSASAPLTYLMAGRWNAWKGHEFLLRAWQRSGQPGHLVILGGPPPAGSGVDVPELAARLGVADSVDVVGEVDDIDSHVNAADIMVVPSMQPEPFGLVSIEAFARGRPVIATDHGGSREIVTPGTGWLVPAGDIGRLADLFRTLDRRQAADAGNRARVRYQREYTVEEFGRRLRAALAVPYPPTRRGGATATVRD